MFRRVYLIISLIAALGVGASLAQSSFAQKEKSKEKEYKEKEKAKPGYSTSIEAPAAYAQALMIREGSYLGVYLEEVTSTRMKDLGVTEERGAVVMKVVEKSPAEKAGLRENDVIVAFNGRRVDSVRELQRLLGETPSGRTVTVEFIRGGNKQTASVTLSDRHKESPTIGSGLQFELFKNHPNFGNFNFGDLDFFRGPRIGIRAESLTDQLGEFFGIKDGKGVLVTQVLEDSPAAKAGLKAGDVITAVDNTPIDNMPALVEAISSKSEGQVVLKIMRNRVEQSLTVMIEKRERDEKNRVRLLPRERLFRTI